MPAISVLMAVHNGAGEVQETIDSIRRQTFEDWEIVLVDDGSGDDTPATLARAAASEPRLRVLRQDNRGLTRALNVALERAAGPLLARIDAGDVAHAERFAKQKAFLDARPEVVCVGSHALFATPQGWPVDRYVCPLAHDEIDADHIAGLPGRMAHACLMLRRAALVAAGGYDVDFPVAQDYDLLLRLAEVGRLANLDEVLTTCRLDLAGVSTRRRAEQVACVAQALARARTRRKLAPLARPPALWVPSGETDFLDKWARQALAAGFYATARRCAWRLLRRRPDARALRLLLRAAYEECRR